MTLGFMGSASGVEICDLFEWPGVHLPKKTNPTLVAEYQSREVLKWGTFLIRSSLGL
jgi:hypothetical protein